MSQKVIDYLGVFGSDERFLVFALASIVLGVALIPLMKGTGLLPVVFATAASLFLMGAFVVLAPLSSLSLAPSTVHGNPVGLSFNCGFLALGIALFLKFFRSSPSSK